jgi:hypothetical protein
VHRPTVNIINLSVSIIEPWLEGKANHLSSCLLFENDRVERTYYTEHVLNPYMYGYPYGDMEEMAVTDIVAMVAVYRSKGVQLLPDQVFQYGGACPGIWKTLEWRTIIPI